MIVGFGSRSVVAGRTLDTLTQALPAQRAQPCSARSIGRSAHPICPCHDVSWQW